jgi:hypothetical protein
LYSMMIWDAMGSLTWSSLNLMSILPMCLPS